MNTLYKLRYTVVVLIFAPFILMGGQCNPEGTTGPEQLNAGAMTVDLPGGDSFISGGAKAVDDGKGSIDISATEDVPGAMPDEVTIVVPKNTILPYTVVQPGDATTTLYYCQSQGSTCTNYFAKPSIGSCTITITQITPTVMGTFSGQVVNESDSNSTLTLSNGAFNAQY